MSRGVRVVERGVRRVARRIEREVSHTARRIGDEAERGWEEWRGFNEKLWGNIPIIGDIGDAFGLYETPKTKRRKEAEKLEREKQAELDKAERDRKLEEEWAREQQKLSQSMQNTQAQRGKGGASAIGVGDFSTMLSDVEDDEEDLLKRFLKKN